MRRAFSLAAVSLLLGGTLSSCARSYLEEERDAARHEQRAQQYAAYGDYRGAAMEQRRARHEHNDAARRQQEQQRYYQQRQQSQGYYNNPQGYNNPYQNGYQNGSQAPAYQAPAYQPPGYQAVPPPVY